MGRGPYRRRQIDGTKAGDDDLAGFVSPYDRAKSIYIKESTSCEAVRSALSFLTETTGDEAFRSALLALDGYGLKEGGLKQKVLKMLSNARLRTEDAAAPLVDQLHKEGRSVNAASVEAAKAFQISPAYLKSKVDDIRKAHKAYAAGDDECYEMPDGATGRHLKVTPASDLDDVNNREVRVEMLCFSGAVEADGFLIVPDDRHWRRWIAAGLAICHGLVKS